MRVWQLIALYDDGHGNYNQEFLLGTFSSENIANDYMEKAREEAKEDKADVDYRIDEHIVISK